MEQFINFVVIFMWPVISVAGIGVAAYFGRRFAIAIERQGVNRQALTDLEARIIRLESDLEDSQRDVSRVEARQEFTTKLLGERIQSPQ